jgi:hypothetical protein
MHKNKRRIVSKNPSEYIYVYLHKSETNETRNEKRNETEDSREWSWGRTKNYLPTSMEMAQHRRSSLRVVVEKLEGPGGRKKMVVKVVVVVRKEEYGGSWAPGADATFFQEAEVLFMCQGWGRLTTFLDAPLSRTLVHDGRSGMEQKRPKKG